MAARITAPRQRSAADLAGLAVMIVLILTTALALGIAASLMPQPAGDAGLGLRALYVVTNYPTKLFSIASFTSGTAIAVLLIGTRAGRTVRRARPLKALRIIFAANYLKHRSHRLDVLYVVANVYVFTLLFGWMILSGQAVTTVVHGKILATLGQLAPSSLAPWLVAVIGSVALYLAYEFGYYLDHLSSHKLPFFWAFHRVHHEAEVLSPLTTFRVHPVESVKFYNILAITGGVTNGLLHWVFGLDTSATASFSGSIVILLFGYVFLQMHHTQIWLPFTGVLGRILISPAHHQIHHSTNPIHFDKNLGSCLAVFDWLFGTLHIPARRREKLVFGVPKAAAEAQHDPHSLEGSVVTPVLRGIAGLAPANTQPASSPPLRA